MGNLRINLIKLQKCNERCFFFNSFYLFGYLLFCDHQRLNKTFIVTPYIITNVKTFVANICKKTKLLWFSGILDRVSYNFFWPISLFILYLLHHDFTWEWTPDSDHWNHYQPAHNIDVKPFTFFPLWCCPMWGFHKFG